MRIKFWFPAALAAIPAVLIVLVYFYGNLITKMESKKIARDYLEDHYPGQPFIVTNVAYYPGEEIYIVHIISKDGSVKAHLDVRKGKVVNDGLLEYKTN
ncbi:YfjL-like protein [Peribacillus deserti]|uniref:YfjL-like N-terminal domain-containing protein n=1 Tax=Peribacillus deserti TaxID=673318 RepID=A0A2N5M276_9BACI|nr:hypothetical protein [Peribacillus deserti]PLT28468.1 hypothetical protein CUU66_18365 [Peribacillus deserti]